VKHVMEGMPKGRKQTLSKAKELLNFKED